MNKFISSLFCFYKYNVYAPIIKRDISYVFNSLKEKKDSFLNKKLELHISPFYEGKNKFLYWQPIFDFDNPTYFEKFKRYILFEENKEDWFIEVTDTCFHLTSKNIYGPIKDSDISKIRKQLHSFSSWGIDITSSIRHLPIKRCLSIINNKYISTPIELVNFKINKINKKEKLSEEQFYNILHNYIFPHKLKEIKSLSFLKEIK